MVYRHGSTPLQERVDDAAQRGFIECAMEQEFGPFEAGIRGIGEMHGDGISGGTVAQNRQLIDNLRPVAFVFGRQGIENHAATDGLDGRVTAQDIAVFWRGDGRCFKP